MHLGTRLPRHLEMNLHSTSKIASAHEVLLIADKQTVRKDLPFKIVLNKSTNNQEYVKNHLLHDSDFREGFWFSTLLRIVAVAEYVIETNAPVLHIESDVIISQNFPFKIFSEISNKIAFPVVSDTHAIASLLYIANADLARELLTFILTYLKSETKATDMLVLHEFQIAKPNLVLSLPTGIIDTKSGNAMVTDKIYAEHDFGLKVFGGVFDGFDIGMYLFGEDPRNHRGVIPLHTLDHESYLNASKLTYKYNKQSQSLHIVNNVFQKTTIPIYSLHIHSKAKLMFSLKTQGIYMQLCLFFMRIGLNNLFSFRIFIVAVKNKCRKILEGINLNNEMK